MLFKEVQTISLYLHFLLRELRLLLALCIEEYVVQIVKLHLFHFILILPLLVCSLVVPGLHLLVLFFSFLLQLLELLILLHHQLGVALANEESQGLEHAALFFALLEQFLYSRTLHESVLLGELHALLNCPRHCSEDDESFSVLLLVRVM